MTLLLVGFTEPPGSPRALVRSYRTVAPLPVRAGCPASHRRFVLCGTVLRVAPTGCYPAPCPLESGRSSDGSSPHAVAQPPHHHASSLSHARDSDKVTEPHSPCSESPEPCVVSRPSMEGPGRVTGGFRSTRAFGIEAARQEASGSQWGRDHVGGHAHDRSGRRDHTGAEGRRGAFRPASPRPRRSPG